MAKTKTDPFAKYDGLTTDELKVELLRLGEETDKADAALLPVEKAYWEAKAALDEAQAALKAANEKSREISNARLALLERLTA